MEGAHCHSQLSSSKKAMTNQGTAGNERGAEIRRLPQRVKLSWYAGYGEDGA